MGMADSKAALNQSTQAMHCESHLPRQVHPAQEASPATDNALCAASGKGEYVAFCVEVTCALCSSSRQTSSSALYVRGVYPEMYVQFCDVFVYILFVLNLHCVCVEWSASLQSHDVCSGY